MAKKTKKPSGFTLTAKQIGLLGGCVVMIAAPAFLLGYGSGTLYERRGPHTLDKPAQPAAPRYAPAPSRQLDPATVKKETAPKTEPREEFTFPEKLDRETEPASRPLPTSPPILAATPKKPAVKQKAAAPPENEKTAAVKPGPERAAKPSRKPPPKSPSIATKKLTLQVASFKGKKDADALARKLSKAGYFAYVVPFRHKGQMWWRVRVGVYETPQAAKRDKEKLERHHKFSALLVTYQR